MPPNKNRSLGIAYSIKRKAKGGKVDHSGSERGVNRAVRAPSLKGGMSDAGLQTRIHQELKEEKHPAGIEALHDAKELHKRVLEESRQIKPKLENLAEGGRVKSRVQFIKAPKMVDSPLKIKRREDIDEEERSAQSKSDIDKNLDSHLDEIHREDEMGMKAEEDEVEHPAHLEDDEDDRRPAIDEIMSDHAAMLAEGGMLTDEEEDEHHASLAAAIMAKRQRMAQGGEVDLEENAEEEPNHEDDLSFDALKKENYDLSDALDDLDQPEDNEHGDKREHSEEDEHDMISRIMSKMKSRRK